MFSERLKLAMQQAGVTQAQIAKACGIKPPSVHAWLNSNSEPSGNNLLKLSKALNVSGQWLIQGKGSMRDDATEGNVTAAAIGGRPIPLIDFVQAGNWTEVVDSYAMGAGSDYLLTDLELSPCAFALQIKGDSMTPDFKEGDRVIIDPDLSPQPGDFVVAKNGKEEATFKKYRPRGINEHGEVIFELVPLNEDYAPMRSDLSPIKIIGVMVEHRKYRRR